MKLFIRKEINGKMEKNRSWIIRNGDERDLRDILSLREAVFGEMEKDKLNPEFWRWEFMGGPDGKAFIYIVEEGGGSSRTSQIFQGGFQ